MPAKDTIRIEITADSQKAQREIERVKDKLNEVSSPRPVSPGRPASSSGAPASDISTLAGIHRQALGRLLSIHSQAMSGIRGPSSSSGIIPSVSSSANGNSSVSSSFSSSGASALSGALGMASRGFGVMLMSGRIAFSGISAAAGALATAVKTVLLSPVRLLEGAFSALKIAGVSALGAIGAAWVNIKAAQAAINPAAEFEQYNVQLEVMLKSSEKAKRRFEELRSYARDTNFNPDEVVSAGIQMGNFGLWNSDGMRRLRALGDLANGVGKSIGEAVHSISYLAAGRTGEAFESLAQFGVTRGKLQGMGLQFDSQGGLVSSTKKAVDTVFKYIERNYGGLTARMGKTWRGSVAQFGGAVKDALASGFESSLGPLTRTLNTITKNVGNVGNALKRAGIGGMISGPLATLSGIADAVGGFISHNPKQRMAAQETLSRAWGGLRGIFSAAWDGLKAISSAVLSGLGDVLGGALESIGRTLSDLASSDGMRTVFDGIKDVIVGSFEVGAALFSGILNTVFPRIMSDMRVLVEKLPGMGSSETDRQRAAMDSAYALASRAALGTEAGMAQYRKWQEADMAAAFGISYRDPSKAAAKRQEIWNDWLAKNYSSEISAAYQRSMGWDDRSSAVEAMKSRLASSVARVFSGARAAFGTAGGAFAGNMAPLSGGIASAAGRIMNAGAGAIGSLSSAYGGFADPLKASTLGDLRSQVYAARKRYSSTLAEGRGLSQWLRLRQLGMISGSDLERTNSAEKSWRKRLSRDRASLEDAVGSYNSVYETTRGAKTDTEKAISETEKHTASMSESMTNLSSSINRAIELLVPISQSYSAE